MEGELRPMSRKKRVPTAAPAPSVAPRLLNVRAAAVYLGSTVWAVRNLGWAHEIPFVRIGRRILFDRADLDTFVERLKAQRAA